MSFFLGIDGGGSKIECVLADEAGAVLARALGEGANLGRVSRDDLQANLGACAGKLQQATGLEKIKPEVVCAGLAGASDAAGREMAQEVLAQLFRAHRIHVVGDMEVALEAAVGAGSGVVLISGTGSIAYGRDRSGRCARAGGHGPEKGDEGSGYDIGRRAVTAAVRAHQAGGERSDLADLLLPTFGVEKGSELGAWLSPAKATELASLVPVVVMAARHGDEKAVKILAAAAESLASLALDVLRDLDLVGTPVRVATHGGVFAACEELLAAVRARIVAASPQARVEPLRVTPGYGGVLLAQRLWAEEKAGTKP